MPNLKKGDLVWLRCEVKPGPFPNERLVRIALPSEPWMGFVDTKALKDPSLETGQTSVLARITQVEGDTIVATVQGHAFDSRHVKESTNKVVPFVSVST